MKLRKFALVSMLLIIVLVITNPSDQDFLQEIATDCGNYHRGQTFDPSDMMEMGQGKRLNYQVFAVYNYTFGDISVSYIGFLNMIFYRGSRKARREDVEYNA
jgi:hypothetical protein